jgi:hypothetical protein
MDCETRNLIFFFLKDAEHKQHKIDIKNSFREQIQDELIKRTETAGATVSWFGEGDNESECWVKNGDISNTTRIGGLFRVKV